MKKILTIAGSDSGGGAGIQADLKTITSLGGYGMSVITAITAQNSRGIRGIEPVSSELIKKQIACIFEDFGADAVKTGMLLNGDITGIVAEKLKKYKVKNLVVDPVMVAKSGDFLLYKKAVAALKKELIPLAFLITPNLYEASQLTGKRVKTISDMKEAAKEIHKAGAKNVLIKGGHLKDDATDILYDGKNFHEFSVKRINTPHTHGVGCTLSAAIATFLANGYDLYSSIEKGKNYLTEAIKCAVSLGKGINPVNHFAPVLNVYKKSEVLNELNKALETLKKENIWKLIPEVSSNIGYCLTSPKSLDDVAAIPGRIIRLGKNILTLANPEFGASFHVGKIVLTINRFDENFRCAMNIKFSDEILKVCRALGFDIAEFSRKKEPKKIKGREGSSLAWGVEDVLKRKGKIPDIIFDRGDVGKEAMIRVMGKNPSDVLSKVVRINRKVK